MKYFKSIKGKRVVCSSTNPNPKCFMEITKKQYEAELLKKEKALQIHKLKNKLAKTDYQAIKHSEGWISEEDYAPIKAARQAIRDEINELEQSLFDETEIDQETAENN